MLHACVMDSKNSRAKFPGLDFFQKQEAEVWFPSLVFGENSRPATTPRPLVFGKIRGLEFFVRGSSHNRAHVLEPNTRTGADCCKILRRFIGNGSHGFRRLDLETRALEFSLETAHSLSRIRDCRCHTFYGAEPVSNPGLTRM